MISDKEKKYLESFNKVQGPLSEDDLDFVEENIEMQEKYGDSSIRTFLESAVSSATFGLSDQAYAALGDDFKQALRERRKRNELAAFGGEVTGIVGPALLSGGSSLIAKGAGVAGKGIANPIASILSFSMALRYSLNLDKEADELDKSVQSVLDKGLRTRDILSKGKKEVSTKEMGDAIIAYLQK